MPVQNCALVRGIMVYSDEIENGSFFIGSRFAPSLCRSISSEKGRGIIWGKAEEEMEEILRIHIRKVLKKFYRIKSIRIIWEGDEDFSVDEEEKTFVRRSNYRAIYIFGKEKLGYMETDHESGGKYSKFCRIESEDATGTYLVCNKIRKEDWDDLMVSICIRSMPFDQ